MLVNNWIDVHAHFTPPMTPEQSDARWTAMQRNDWVGPKPPDWSEAAALAYMDRLRIAMQMLSHIPKTLDALRGSNDYGASLVRRHPSRFWLLAALLTDDRGASGTQMPSGGVHPINAVYPFTSSKGPKSWPARLRRITCRQGRMPAR